MEVMQGTIDIGTKCRTFLDNKKHAGIVFYKENAFLTGFVNFIIGISVFVCIYIGYQYGFKFFLLSSSICLLLLIAYTQIQKRIDEKDGARYFLDEIDEVKILDNQSLSSYSKSQSGSLAGAAIGAVVLGGVGAVVGSVSSGNKTTIEQIINIGIKLKDSNWVVVTANVNDSIVGKAEKKAVNDLLEMTRKQQQAPF